MGHWLDLGRARDVRLRGLDVNGVLAGKHAPLRLPQPLQPRSGLESIVRGYQRHAVTKRPFMLTRSGAAGIQRFGAAMWSGDIGSNLTALATQQNVQMHMSMSGIDYYGSDIGGFRREMLDTDLKELYTQWFANGAWFDVPVRPHTDNLCNCARDLAGLDRATWPATSPTCASATSSMPYYYSLAHRAYLLRRAGDAAARLLLPERPERAARSATRS